MGFYRPLKCHWLLPLVLAILQNFTVRPYCCRCVASTLSHRTWRKKSGTNMEISSLLISFHSAQKSYLCYQGSGGEKYLLILYTCDLKSYNNCWSARYADWNNSDINAIRVSNHLLIGIKVRLPVTELVVGTVNWAKIL